jgi:tetratricopeptide (TPR) repeat protein
MRLTCIFWQPEEVCRSTERALALARRHKLRFEEAVCLNNLGTQHWYLKRLDRARECFEASAEMLAACGAYRKDVPLNNLGLIALAEGRIRGAAELFREARAVSLSSGDRLFIRANEAVASAMEGDLDIAIEVLSGLAVEADAAGSAFHRDCVRYNLARALLLRGRASEAIDAATACAPRRWLTDDLLVIAKRAVLLMEAAAMLGREPDPVWAKQAAILQQTKKPQVWLYQLPWELCDTQIWQD